MKTIPPGGRCNAIRISAQETVHNHTGLLFPSEPSVLWNLFKDVICNDLKYCLQTTYHIQNPEDDQVYDFGLYPIDKILNQAGTSLDQFRDMPQITGHWEEIVGNW